MYVKATKRLLTWEMMDKIPTISQTIFSDIFYEWKLLYFDKKKITAVCSKGPVYNNPAFI